MRLTFAQRQILGRIVGDFSQPSGIEEPDDRRFRWKFIDPRRRGAGPVAGPDLRVAAAGQGPDDRAFAGPDHPQQPDHRSPAARFLRDPGVADGVRLGVQHAVIDITPQADNCSPVRLRNVNMGAIRCDRRTRVVQDMAPARKFAVPDLHRIKILTDPMLYAVPWKRGSRRHTTNQTLSVMTFDYIRAWKGMST